VSEVTRAVKLSFARFHGFADGVLRRLEGAEEALADITADLARLARIVAQRRGYRLPAGDGGLGVGLRCGSRRSGGGTCFCGWAPGIAEGAFESFGRIRGIGQRKAVAFTGA